jgi:hypothetical protein
MAEKIIQEKMARICWNSDNYWRKPSGREGKSLSTSSYERKYGFGHEEWLFDLDKTIDGYHYGAIQPIGAHQDSYYEYCEKNKVCFKILLYTRNAVDKKWYWVGWLNKVEVISSKEAKKIYEEYKKLGWLDLMKEDLMSVGGKIDELDSGNICNIKFLPDDIIPMNNGLQPFDINQKMTNHRYILLNTNSKIKNSFENPEADKNHKTTFIRSSDGYLKEYEFTHRLIQDAFFNYLQRNFINKTLEPEYRKINPNCSIDIYQEKDTGVKIIYEIKTYIDLKYSLRIALGQLLEYGYYPDRDTNYKLILVSDRPISDDIKQYIENLKRLFNLDIGIINFDYQNKILKEVYNCAGCDFA